MRKPVSGVIIALIAFFLIRNGYRAYHAWEIATRQKAARATAEAAAAYTPAPLPTPRPFPTPTPFPILGTAEMACTGYLHWLIARENGGWQDMPIEAVNEYYRDVNKKCGAFIGNHAVIDDLISQLDDPALPKAPP